MGCQYVAMGYLLNNINVLIEYVSVHMDSGLRRDEIFILSFCFYSLFCVILIYT